MSQTRTRTYPSRPDYWLLAVTGALVVVGLISVYSAAMSIDPDSPSYYVIRQAGWGAIGVLAMLVVARMDYHRWQLYTLPLLVLSMFVLALLVVLGSDVFGATRWLYHGSVQPSEAMKVALVIYVAYWLSTKGDEIRKATYGLVPFSVLVGGVVGLILLQPDFSTAMLIGVVAMVMFFVAGADVVQLLVTGLAGMASAGGLILISPYRTERVASFAAALKDPLTGSYHVRQAVIALGSGGLGGKGLGGGVLKFGHLPAAHTDSIFAVIGEELGFIGCLSIVALFVFLAWRGYRVVLHAEDSFGAYLATGLVSLVVLQAAVNIAVATATVPFTGIPLPFISAGGSSLVASMLCVGILFNISGHRLEE